MTKKTYLKSVDILLDAYNTNKLFHGDCSACAVGNLLGGVADWQQHFMTDPLTGNSDIITLDFGFKYNREQLHLLYKKKGFCMEELAKIENVFENSIRNTREGYEYYQNEQPKKGQYIGLCAVLELMATMVEDEVTNCQKEATRLTEIATNKFNVIC